MELSAWQTTIQHTVYKCTALVIFGQNSIMKFCARNSVAFVICSLLVVQSVMWPDTCLMAYLEGYRECDRWSVSCLLLLTQLLILRLCNAVGFWPLDSFCCPLSLALLHAILDYSATFCSLLPKCIC